MEGHSSFVPEIYEVHANGKQAKFVGKVWINLVSEEEFNLNSLPATFEFKKKPVDAFGFVKDSGDDR